MAIKRLLGGGLLQRAAGSGLGAYATNVVALAPLAYWQLNEIAGAVATDSSGNGYHGTYSGVVLNSTAGAGASMGNAPLFDGVNDSVGCSIAALMAAMSKTAGTMSFWVKVLNAGIWADGTKRQAFYWTATTTLENFKSAGANTFRSAYNGVQASNTAISSTAWINFIATWDQPGAGVSLYTNNVLSQVSLTPVAILGAISSVVIGNNEFSSATWSGYLQHVALWASVQSAGNRTILATAA